MGAMRMLVIGALALTSCSTIYVSEPVPDPGLGRVVRHVDGDTFRVMFEGRDESVRFIGIDTPERGERFFDQASAFTARLAPIGTQVWLEFDDDERDRYQRILAYVWLADPDGAEPEEQMLNARIAAAGWADVLAYCDTDRYQDLFARLVSAAKDSRLGRWKTDDRGSVDTSCRR